MRRSGALLGGGLVVADPLVKLYHARSEYHGVMSIHVRGAPYLMRGRLYVWVPIWGSFGLHARVDHVSPILAEAEAIADALYPRWREVRAERDRRWEEEIPW